VCAHLGKGDGSLPVGMISVCTHCNTDTPSNVCVFMGIGGACIRLLVCPVPILATVAVGPREMVVHADVHLSSVRSSRTPPRPSRAGDLLGQPDPSVHIIAAHNFMPPMLSHVPTHVHRYYLHVHHRYFFYKSASFSLCHLLFAFHCGASGLTVYDPLYTSMYNVIFTSLPVMFVAIFEQVIISSARTPLDSAVSRPQVRAHQHALPYYLTNSPRTSRTKPRSSFQFSTRPAPATFSSTFTRSFTRWLVGFTTR
jgi:hypothetical protein